MASNPISTGTHPATLWPGIAAIFGQKYDAYDKEYKHLYEEKSSTQAYEKDLQITGFGLMAVKPEGQPVSYDSETQGFNVTYNHITYALGYIVTYEELQDNLYKEVATKRAEALAFSVDQTIEVIAAVPYNNAFASTVFTAGDGLAMCSPAHINATGGTYSNAMTPAADLTERSIENLVIQLSTAQSDRNLTIALIPESLHIAPQEWFNANRILGSVLQSNTANNNINVLKAVSAFPKGIHMNHFFTSSHAWFIRTNCPRGMMMFWRERPELAQDNETATRNALAMTFMRLSVGITDPRGIFGSNGT